MKADEKKNVFRGLIVLIESNILKNSELAIRESMWGIAQY